MCVCACVFVQQQLRKCKYHTLKLNFGASREDLFLVLLPHDIPVALVRLCVYVCVCVRERGENTAECCLILDHTRVSETPTVRNSSLSQEPQGFSLW